MFKIILFSLLISIIYSSISIPLKIKEVTTVDKNQNYVDSVLYADIKLQEVGANKATIEETVIFETLASKNYVMTKNVKYTTPKITSPTLLNDKGVECNGYCTGENSSTVTGESFAEGAKIKLKGKQK